jgi:DNA mismatch repair protein MutH
MKKLPYDDSDRASIREYAIELLHKSLRDVVSKEIFEQNQKEQKAGNKGDFGQLVERLHFQIENNSAAKPDLPKVGVEIKTTPLKRTRSGIRSKERLVLNIIDFMEEYKRTFPTSSFWKKNEHLLLMCYLYKIGVPKLDYVFKLIDYWEFPEEDLEVIRHDWAVIVEKIKQGEAHKLSEGDTFYLGACTKGGKGGNPRPQPFNSLLAKQRAFSLKQGYVNHMIASLSGDASGAFGKIIKRPALLKRKTLDEIVLERFQPFYGKTVNQIVQSLGLTTLKKNAKNFYASLTKAILKVGTDEEIEEFAKADIVIRTSRVNSDGLPEESISFPYFDYRTIVNERWDYSQFKSYLETKFFFVFFQYEGSSLVLRKARFWNMPYDDIQEAKKVWHRAISILKDGKIVKAISAAGVRSTNFPKSTENCVAHVRPHARNKNDTSELPTPDRFTGLSEYTKHSFWLNDRYVKNEIFLK